MDKLLLDKWDRFMAPEFDSLLPNEKYGEFVLCIKEAIETHTPKKHPVNLKTVRNPVSWWDEDCARIIRQRRAAYKKWQYTTELKDLVKYKQLVAKARRTFKLKKTQDFRNFAANIDIKMDSQYAWNKAKIFKNKWVKTNPDSVKENLQKNDAVETALNKICPP